MRFIRTANAGGILETEGCRILLDGVCAPLNGYEGTPSALLAQLLASAMLFGAIYMAVKAAPDHRLLYALAMGCVYLGLGLLLRAALGAGSGVALHGSAVLPLIAAVAGTVLQLRHKTPPRRPRIWTVVVLAVVRLKEPEVALA